MSLLTSELTYPTTKKIAMPMLVRTPEDIFRAEKKDIHAIHNLEGTPSNESGMMLIAKWLKENLPETKTELLAPSENSGFVVGGINGTLRVDFTSTGLQMFCDRWEKNEASVDPRFQCYLHPYLKWFEAHGQFVPTMVKPTELGFSVWWHTPVGFIYHKITLQEAEAKGLRAHPANPQDLWMHMAELLPEVAALKTGDLTYGSIGRDIERGTWYALYTPPFVWSHRPKFKPPTPTQIRDWFCLPVKSRVMKDSY